MRKPTLFQTLILLCTLVAVRLVTPRPARADEFLPLIGHIGGDIESVLRNGNTLYVSEGAGVTLLDVSDPTAPVVIGKTPLLDKPIRALARNGSTLFALTDFGRIAAFDVAQSPPALLDSYKHPHVDGAHAITYANGHLFVAAYGKGVLIVDVSDPTRLRTVARYPLNGNAGAYAVAVVGNHAFVGAAYSGVIALDISTLGAPVEVDRIPIMAGVFGVAVRDHVLYTNDGLQMFDISDPADLQIIGETFNESDYNGQGVLVEGDLAISYDINFGIDLYDISDPFNPVYLTQYDSDGWASTLATDGSFLYIASSHDGLRIIDITARVPSEVAAYRTGGRVQDVAVAGDHAYVVGWQHGMTALDISDPTRPQAVGAFEPQPGDGQAVAVNGSYLYVVDEYYGLRVFDLANPAQPVNLGGRPINSDNQTLRNVLAAGNRTFVGTDLTYSFRTLNPAAPEQQQYFEGAGYGMVLAGSYLYRATGFWGLTVLDVSNLGNMVEVGRYDMGFATAVARRGNIAWVLASDGLHGVDVSDPTDPQPVGFLALGRQAFAPNDYEVAGDVEVVGNRAFVALGAHGIAVIDISDPTAPALLASAPTFDSAWRLRVVDDLVYVADQDGGLLIFRYSGVPSAVTLASAATSRAGGAVWPLLALLAAALTWRARWRGRAKVARFAKSRYSARARTLMIHLVTRWLVC